MVQRILVVEDSPSTLGALAEMLERAGYVVATAMDFAGARGKLDEDRPDLLIVDVRLGPYNGLHLAIRERLDHPDLPVIITTGFADPTLEAEARRYGAVYLEKPIRPVELLAMVKTLLDRVGHVPPLLSAADRGGQTGSKR